MKNNSKYARCPECHLHIRCGDPVAHEAGYHHGRRKKTLAEAAKKAERLQ